MVSTFRKNDCPDLRRDRCGGCYLENTTGVDHTVHHNLLIQNLRVTKVRVPQERRKSKYLMRKESEEE